MSWSYRRAARSNRCGGLFKIRRLVAETRKFLLTYSAGETRKFLLTYSAGEGLRANHYLLTGQVEECLLTVPLTYWRWRCPKVMKTPRPRARALTRAFARPT